MTRSFRSLVVCAIFVAAASLRAQTSTTPSAALDGTTPQRVPGVVYVQFLGGYNPQFAQGLSPLSVGATDAVQKIFHEIGVTRIEPFDKDASKDAISHKLGIDRMYVVYYSSDAHPLGVTLRLLQTGFVQTASPRYIFTPQSMTPQSVPAHNDPLFDQQWYLDTVRADSAWSFTEGDPSIVIADVDEGVNYNHEDLAANMVDHGYNAASGGVGDAMPAAGANEGEHGTETAGCFGAVLNNGLGIAGVAPLCKILAVKIANDQGALTAGYEGIHYAATRGANIINCSWGGTIDPSALAFEQTFADEVTQRNEILVASAGNYAKNNDITPFYPACLAGVLSVGASNDLNQPSPFTHFGKSVLVYAPGEQIMTTTLQPGNSSYTDPPGVAGTSFSGPITAGICGLLMSFDKTLPAASVQKIVVQTGDPINPEGRPDLFTGLRVNAYKALNSISHPTNPNVSAINYKIDATDTADLDQYNSDATVEVTFKNSGADDVTGINATLLPGPGYSWENYSAFSSKWPNSGIGYMDQKGTDVGRFYQIFRSKQFSEGNATLTFALSDQANYRDTVRVNVPLTKQPGMLHAIEVPHATCIKQVDSVYGWAGFGYWTTIKDPETNTLLTFKITQFARRHRFADGKSGWDVSPTDINQPDIPFTCIDALDSNTAWFGGGTTLGGTANYVYYTTDGGNSWQTQNQPLPVMPKWIHFSDANNGMLMSDAVSGTFQRYVTSDGGQNWTLKGVAGAKYPNEKVFNNGCYWSPDGKLGVFGSDSGYVYRTLDGGVSWSSANINGTNIRPSIRFVTSICFSADRNIGYALVQPMDTGIAVGGTLFYCTDKNGIGWTQSPMLNVDTKASELLRIPYSVTFKPGTDTAIVTTNQGIFLVAYTGRVDTPTTWQYYSAPSTWNSSASMISAAGTANQFTVSAASEGSGVVDRSTQPVEAAAVHTTSSGQALQLIASPNPSSGTSQIYFSLASDDNVDLELTDVLGRTVEHVFSGFLSAGDHVLPVDASSLPAGVYHCTLAGAHGAIGEASVVLMR